MANQFRLRSGQVSLRKFNVLPETRIDRGDMVFVLEDSDGVNIYPASDFTWTSNLATTQGNFAAAFAGIAADSSAVGQSSPINVDISSTSVYEMDCATASYHLNDTLGPDEATSRLRNQTLENAAAAASIARAAETRASTTKLRVTFAPAFSTQSSNVNANIG